MPRPANRPWHSTNRASGKPGAIHDELGGFRGFGQGWLPTDREYIGVTDGTRVIKFPAPASYPNKIGDTYVIGFGDRTLAAEARRVRGPRANSSRDALRR